MKKIIALFLAMFCLTATFTGCGSSENSKSPNNSEEKPSEPSPVKDFEFEASENGLTVTKYLGSAKQVVIPSIVDNKKVVDLKSDVFGGNVVVEEIVLSDYMTKLYIDCFKGCDNLKTLTCSGFVEYDSYYVLDADTYPDNLTTIIFPSVQSIDVNVLQTIKNTSNVNTFICNYATEIKTIDFHSKKNYKGEYNIVLPDALVDELKSKPAYCYKYSIKTRSEFDVESEITAWTLDIPFTLETDDILDESKIQFREFIVLVNDIISEYKKEGYTIVDFNYYSNDGNYAFGFTYKGKNDLLHYYNAKYGIDFYWNGKEEVDEVKFHIDSHISYECTESKTDPTLAVTTAFGRVDSITVNGTTYSYDHE